ncbi:hypothetical protein ILUMI_19334 [Ignelater luminosus]|uniref:RNA-directed DNA polymerase n=1 Tax=Ignelater luminosus TaxID=2038154 RepID=A0A8K0CGD3_IGNLU|nr:hypothetical protein ILUMI_19334 [Ignelater luminosus]
MRIEELVAALQGGEQFTKLDLKRAYNQLELTETTKRLLAWSTHGGIYQPTIKYLGHYIDKDGLHKDKEKVRTIVETCRPKDVSEVKTFVGMVNYYGKFVLESLTVLEPLYSLLISNTVFNWSTNCKKVFLRAKRIISTKQSLAHFDANLPIKLVCDASDVGVGAECERNYSVIHKEALAVFWGVRGFYQYLMRIKFILCTDHKPSLAIFGERKGIPQIAAGRLQKWAVFLSGYVFQHIKGKDNGDADGLSRFPIENDEISQTEFDYFNDRVLSEIFMYTNTGWPLEINEELKLFERRKYKVLIPDQFKNQLLEEIHGAHNRFVKIKTLTRQYFWRPNLDRQIEDYVMNCGMCRTHASNPEKAVLVKFKKGKNVFERVHIDFLGPIKNKMFLIITDAFSKWPEIYEMPKIDLSSTIEKLKDCFARFGLPNTIISDNGA